MALSFTETRSRALSLISELEIEAQPDDGSLMLPPHVSLNE